MDPISATLGIIGLGMQIFGGVKSSEIAHEQADVSQDEARQEQGINDLKQRQMEMEGRRSKLEQIRTAQRAQALAVNRATGQGAQFGSGLQGGLAQVQDQSMFNIQGIDNSLEIGRGINVFNQNISADKMKMAALGGDAATAQGISSIGGALIKSGPIFGQIAQGFGGNSYGGLAAGKAFNNSNMNSSYYGPLN